MFSLRLYCPPTDDEKLTPEILARREFHIKNALASFALEGEYPSKECEVLLKKYVSGEIKTLDELRIRLFEK
ncbi:antitoxin VbhA family protein [Glaesserella parasuis]|uniref:antitoxin VbhA family protein n=1 Tax=Glaesserella parasuis TaxID=738 RepID=UPI002EABB725|nr:antitoxin VbhA family protein [Glaesserella parasuis]